jgi:hypothetical protein
MPDRLKVTEGTAEVSTSVRSATYVFVGILFTYRIP